MNTTSSEACKPSFVQLKNFSGPLDHLLQLVQHKEMDILQVDLSEITNRYLEYLKQTPELDLEQAGDFIRIIGILIYIKSKSLFPEEDQEDEILEPLIFQQELPQLLLTYQRFQKAGELLYSKVLLGRDCWKSPRKLQLKDSLDMEFKTSQEERYFQLIQAYRHSLVVREARKNYKLKPPSIPHFLYRLKQIAGVFTIGARIKFNQIALIHKEKYSDLLSFLSVLELSKAGFVSLFQNRMFSNIEIFVKKKVTEESIQALSQEEKTVH